jgi:putative photosynthetic complex assembly protein
MSHAGTSPLPRPFLLGAAALLASSIALTGAARWTGIGIASAPAGEVLERVALHFADRPNGAVDVLRAPDRGVVAVLEPGTHGFARSVVRGLVRERRATAVGAEPPFDLVRWSDGRLSLDDPATGRRVELTAFGVTNAGVFAGWLAAGTPAP